MRAFVTGATGFVGNNLCHALVEAGWEVRGLARTRDKAEHILGDLPVEVVVGDMTDVQAFASSLEGCDVLFHTAAYFKEYTHGAHHWERLEAINVQGTLAIAKAAEAAGVRRMVQVDSGGNVGGGYGSAPAGEDTPPGDWVEFNLYFKSKVAAEEALRAWAEGRELEVVHVLPTWIMGPRDFGPTPGGKLFQRFLERGLPAIPAGGSTVVDVRDVALGMVAAAERGRAGQRYILGGRYADLTELCELLERESGVPAPTRRVPASLSVPLAWVMQVRAKLSGTEPLVTVPGVRAMLARRRFANDKARGELGVDFRPLEETVRDGVEWFRAQAIRTPGG